MDNSKDLRALKEGWNGFSAPPPSEETISKAERLLDVLAVYEIVPCHYGPSANGGVHFAFFNHVGVEYVLEFLNDGHTTTSICDCGTVGGKCAAHFEKLFADLERKTPEGE